MSARFLLSLSLACLICTSASAQPVKQQIALKDIAVFPQPGGPNNSSVLVLANRRTIQRLKTCETLLEEKKYSEAVPLLQSLLDLDQDGFYNPDSMDRKQYLSVRGETMRMVGNLPADARTIYEQQNGPSARRMLNQASAERDAALLVEACRRYFHTQAGYEANYLLGLSLMDESQMLAAALCFQRLRDMPNVSGKWEPLLSLRTAVCWHQAGMKENAQQVLTELRTRSPEFALGGKTFSIPVNEDDRENWLTANFQGGIGLALISEFEWGLFRGNPTRNALTKRTDQKASQQWTAQTIFDPLNDPLAEKESQRDTDLRNQVKKLATQVQGQQVVPLPKFHPLVVDDSVLVRTFGNLRSYAVKTGKLQWESIVETEMEMLLAPEENIPNLQNYRNQLLMQRIWSDTTHGTLSSDGDRLYSIEELGVGRQIVIPSTVPGQRPRVIQPAPHNTLVAYHLKGKKGHRAWAVGGTPQDELFELPLAGTFFLGPPLPLAGRLYCLADVSGEIRLLCLHPDTGKLDWAQPLAGAGWSIQQNPVRRTAGTAVAFADGVMVCMTDSGWVVAVDLTNRSLMWGYKVTPAANNGQPVPPRPRPQPNRTPVWMDSLPTIAQGKILLTPRYLNSSANEIHCLDLLSGKLLWKQHQAAAKPKDGLGDLSGNELYIAGVVDNQALVVSSNEVTSYDITTGKRAWEKSIAIDTPAGRGFIQDEQLLIPQTTNKITVLNWKTGKVDRELTAPEGTNLGNVITAQGLLVSQGVSDLSVFPLPDLTAKPE